jgi:hypothetical protein
MDLHPTYITGRRSADWQQWGEKLGDTVDLMDALADAACDHGLADERDSDDEPDFEPSIPAG